MATIYRKTDKGQAEIETRVHHLSPRLRTALILVDGHRSDDELRKLITVQADEALGVLREQGFIDVAPLPHARAERSAGAAVGSAAGVVVDAKAFEQRRRECVRALNEAAGPMADSLAIKMEKARTAAELRPLLEAARSIVANARGATAAAEFSARFLEPIALAA